MSKEEFLKIQTCVLKVSIHCDGCKQKVRKILHKIDGVYKTDVDADQGKVTVWGNVDSATLIRKLNKAGKHAELWGAQKPSNNQLNNQLKSLQIDNGKGGNHNNPKAQKGGGQQLNQPQSQAHPHPHPQQPKGGQPQNLQQQQQQQLQQLQQLQQMKAFQDLKLPQLKGMGAQNPKAVKFDLSHEEDLSDDEFGDYDDDDDFDDDEEFDDEMDDMPPPNKMKPMMGNMGGGGLGPQGPNPMMLNEMMKQRQQFMNAQQQQQQPPKGGGGGSGSNGAPNQAGKKGGGSNGNIPVQIHDGKNGGGKKGGGGGGNQNQGGGKNGGKNGPGDAKNGNHGGGGGSKDGNNGHGGGNVGKKPDGMPAGGAGMGGVNPGLNHPTGMGQMSQMGPMGPMPGAQMANMQMGGIPAVHGLPAAPMNGPGPGYYPGAAPEMMAAGNPYQQQYMAQVMMNQQRAAAAAAAANGNERFQHMMYARPPPAVNYMPPPYPYPYPPPHVSDPYSSYFSDENTSSCSIM